MLSETVSHKLLRHPEYGPQYNKILMGAPQGPQHAENPEQRRSSNPNTYVTPALCPGQRGPLILKPPISLVAMLPLKAIHSLLRENERPAVSAGSRFRGANGMENQNEYTNTPFCAAAASNIRGRGLWCVGTRLEVEEKGLRANEVGFRSKTTNLWEPDIGINC